METNQKKVKNKITPELKKKLENSKLKYVNSKKPINKQKVY